MRKYEAGNWKGKYTGHCALLVQQCINEKKITQENILQTLLKVGTNISPGHVKTIN